MKERNTSKATHGITANPNAITSIFQHPRALPLGWIQQASTKPMGSTIPICRVRIEASAKNSPRPIMAELVRATP